jgi:hypothetical protein
VKKSIEIGPIIVGGGASHREPHYHVSIWAVIDTNDTRTSWTNQVERLLRAEMNPISIIPILDKAWLELKRIDKAFVQANGQKMHLAPPKGAQAKHEGYLM